ncbi:hypothetical protein SAMN04487946_101174 [Halobellus clavatus]|jgi:hypothetical protein|uniref:Uncharacterized protein n=1 Tax=Halobellus clavatus TaxID=660517 RepID=A0A1H3CSC7_9EURY|nr:hypothetical protein SAMN04487946_101174 [Halobellus clavatus]
MWPDAKADFDPETDARMKAVINSRWLEIGSTDSGVDKTDRWRDTS